MSKATSPDWVFDFKNAATPSWTWFGPAGLHELAEALRHQGLDAHAMEREVHFQWIEAFTQNKMGYPPEKIAFLKVGDDCYNREGLIHWGKFLRDSHKSLRKNGSTRFSDSGEMCYLGPMTPLPTVPGTLGTTPKQLEAMGSNLMQSRIPRVPPRKTAPWPKVFQPARPHDLVPLGDLDDIEPMLHDYVAKYGGKNPGNPKIIATGVLEHATRGRKAPPGWLVRRPVAYASDHLLLLDHRLAVEYGEPLRRVCVGHTRAWDDLTPEQKALDPDFDPALVRLGMVSAADTVLAAHVGACKLQDEPGLAGVAKAMDIGAQHATLQTHTPSSRASPSRGGRL